jgi:ATP-binding cassette subfamily B multidrug efflux pump
MKSYRTLWPYFRRHAGRLALGIAALIICDLLQLLIPRVVKTAVDYISAPGAATGRLAVFGLIILAMALAVGLFRYIWRILILGFSRVVEKDIRGRLHAQLLILHPQWFMTRTTGDIMAHATNDLEAVRMAAGFGLVAIADAILMGAASIGFMIWIDLRLTLLAMIPMPLVTILTRRLGKAMHRRYRRVQGIFGNLTGLVREYLSGVRVVKASVTEDLAVRAVGEIGEKYVRENVRLNAISGAFFPLMIMFTNISLAIVLYVGGKLAISGAISVGEFVAFLSYLALITWPMMALGWVTNLVQRGAASLDRINGVLEKTPDILDPETPRTPDATQGHVRFENLHFTFPGRTEPVLNGLTMDCPAKRITAIVGRTGSGKSTALNLIPRLFDPPPGAVFLDGIDVRDLSLEDLRCRIGYVPQDGYIFSGTVADNLAFGKPDATMDEIRQAARHAELDEEIMSFPNGYQTIVGERGITLSGGQKQRLSLARALLMDPAILILDDTFSAVDAAAEERIVHRLAEQRNRTTILASHRLTTLKAADLIHVIENGQVDESGTQEQLIEQGGYFARLYRLQSAQAEASRLPEPPPAPATTV